MYAVSRGRSTAVLFLLKRGAGIHAISENKETALGRAAVAALALLGPWPAVGLALLNIVVFHGRVQATQGSWDADETPPTAARMSAAASLVLWTLVIICGRFIPYNWYDCGKAQPDFINWVQQCKTSEKGEQNMAGQRFDAQMWKAQP